jgi:CBS domain-containing protein/RNA polymerase-binding transcription factor DksA
MSLEIKSLMTGNPVSIEPGAPALAALDLMVEHGIRHLVVIDPEKKIRGVLSIDDLRAALPIPVNLKVPPKIEERRGVADMIVADVMTYAPVTLPYDASIEEAVERMIEGRFGCLPIVDEQGRLDGILTEIDLLHALATLLAQRGNGRPTPRSDSLLDAFKRERAQLVNQLEEDERRIRERAARGREIPLDSGELGKASEEGMLTQQLADRSARRLQSIEKAIERATRGEMDVCERCSGLIPEPRLRALPGETFCIRCAREVQASR